MAQKEALSQKGPIGSGDQAVFSQWDSIVPKLAGFRRQFPNAQVIHDFHLGDGLGRSNLQGIEGLAVTTEFYRRDPNTGKEIPPSWFAVSDVMPFLTLETTMPKRYSEVLRRKFGVFAEETAQRFSAMPLEERKALEKALGNIGLPNRLPLDTNSIYKQLTESNWMGIVDTSGKSASSFALSDILPYQRQLMRSIYKSSLHNLPPQKHAEMRRRFETLAGKNGRIYPHIEGKMLPEVAETTYKVLAQDVETIAGVDLSGVELAETTEMYRLPKPDEIDEGKAFTFFDWYINNRELYTTAHNKISNATSNGIQGISAKSGETPFWVIQNGEKTKLYITDEGIHFGETMIPTNTEITSHRDLAKILYDTFPSNSFSLTPTAIGFLFQSRIPGDFLLPERGSGYVDQANRVWHEIVANASGKAIRPILQNDILRVHPHALSALPDGELIRLPWYVQRDFQQDKNGFTTTTDIKARWQDVVEQRRQLVAEATQAANLVEKARVLFKDIDSQFIHGAIDRYTEITNQEKHLKEQREAILKAIKTPLDQEKQALEEARKREKREIPSDKPGVDFSIVGRVGAFLSGKDVNLNLEDPRIVSYKEELQALREQNQSQAQKSEERSTLEAVLEYASALRLKELEGGIEALEYYDARPSALTTYLLFGDEGIAKLAASAEVVREETDHEPAVVTSELNAEGNMILIVEDKLGWAVRHPEGEEAFAQQIVDTLKSDHMDTAVILTSPNERSDADYKVLILEKDGSFSNMCGNGVRAAARFMYDTYGQQTVSLETKSGETVIGYKKDGESEYGARLSKVVSLAAGQAEEFGDLLSERIKTDPDPLALIQVLANQQGVDLELFDIRHVLQEPHVIANRPDDLDIEQLAQSAETLLALRDTEGNPVFPHGVNINFLETVDYDAFQLLTYERGVNDFTGSCGTGAVCVSSLWFEATGQESIRLHTKGGEINVSYENEHYKIEGHVRRIVE